MKRLIGLLTCHDRKEATLSCLRALHAQESEEPLHVLLTDDGSVDGTAEAVTAAYPDARILRGDGSLFWNGGMRLAFGEALRHGYDYYLWLNDDTLLFPNALASLTAAHRALAAVGEERSIVVGTVRDPASGRSTYGGVVRASRWHPIRYRLVEPNGALQRCDTINGNCVLIPRSVATLVGNLDPAFTHGMGDFDYALRARRLGCSVWVAPEHVGVCSKNSAAGTWEDPAVPLAERWRRVRGPKGLPPVEWKVFVRRHGGTLWPLFWATPYLRVAWSSLRHRLSGGR